MRPAFLLALVGALFAHPAMAQVRPTPGVGDPRIQTVMYDPEQVVLLQVSTGYQLTVEFAPDERIENVAVGDSGAWQITPNKRGDHLFIKPTTNSVITNLTVITDARTYVFELAPGGGSTPAYTIRFDYPKPPLPAPGDSPALEAGRYKLSGTAALRPDAISDDGLKTYIIWRDDQTLPAVFVIDRQGRETLADGAMRDGRYVLDSVNDRLIFRLDKQTAGAQRVPQAKR
jgi:type IV secretion system protein VirB9